MKWLFRNLIFDVLSGPDWAAMGALTPTPVVLGDFVRVFAGFRDRSGVSRIGYVDIEPHRGLILGFSTEPVLDVGKPGQFDDSGVILGDVVKVNDDWYMYYVGFQKVEKVKFLAYSGLACSKDLINFRRIQETPILDRTPSGHFIMAIHSVLKHDAGFNVYFAGGSGWTVIGGISYPQYQIFYTQSVDGVKFSDEYILCIPNTEFEYRCGRPRVFYDEGVLRMSFTRGDLGGGYYPASAFSKDGRVWVRDDSLLQPMPDLSNPLIDRHLCYPVYFEFKGGSYCVFNGNDMGARGVILGELVND